VIEKIMAQKGPAPQLFNLNLPIAALAAEERRLKVVPMGLARVGEQYEKRIDPRGRSYFWALSEPSAATHEEDSDISALRQGYITLTPLDFDLTKRPLLAEMNDWNFRLAGN
jgi:5'-nucleotidase